MALNTRAFRASAPTQNTVVGTVATTVTLNLTMGTFAVRFCNIGTALVFVLPGEATQTDATLTNAIPIPAGQTEIFTFSNGTRSYSVIGAATGSTLYSTVGEGL